MASTLAGAPQIRWRSGAGNDQKANERGGIRKMVPQLRIGDDPDKCRPRGVFHLRLLFQQVEPDFTIEPFEIAVLVQMLDGAAHVVDLPHQLVIPWPNEKLAPAFELPLGLPGIRQDQAVNAARVLVQAVENIGRAPGLDINVQCAEQAPMASGDRSADAMASSRLPRRAANSISLATTGGYGRKMHGMGLSKSDCCRMSISPSRRDPEIRTGLCAVAKGLASSKPT
jgi:hypothetical protein